MHLPIPYLRLLKIIALVVLLTAPIAPVWAGSFSVTPVRIYMTPRDRAVAVTITNEGDSPVALQADINVWSQKVDGTDELVLTEDMILSPPIIKLAAKARQVVRLALLKPADASRQLTYRLIVREIPEAVAPKDNVISVPIALALSMPVFITPPIAQREVACLAVRSTVPPSPPSPPLPLTSLLAIAISCANTGSAYAQVREATLKRGEVQLARFEGGVYILPGASKPINLKTEQAVPAGDALLNVTFDDGKSQAFNVMLP